MREGMKMTRFLVLVMLVVGAYVPQAQALDPSNAILKTVHTQYLPYLDSDKGHHFPSWPRGISDFGETLYRYYSAILPYWWGYDWTWLQRGTAMIEWNATTKLQLSITCSEPGALDWTGQVAGCISNTYAAVFDATSSTSDGWQPGSDHSGITCPGPAPGCAIPSTAANDGELADLSWTTLDHIGGVAACGYGMCVYDEGSAPFDRVVYQYPNMTWQPAYDDDWFAVLDGSPLLSASPVMLAGRVHADVLAHFEVFPCGWFLCTVLIPPSVHELAAVTSMVGSPTLLTNPSTHPYLDASEAVSIAFTTAVAGGGAEFVVGGTIWDDGKSYPIRWTVVTDASQNVVSSTPTVAAVQGKGEAVGSYAGIRRILDWRNVPPASEELYITQCDPICETQRFADVLPCAADMPAPFFAWEDGESMRNIELSEFGIWFAVPAQCFDGGERPDCQCSTCDYDWQCPDVFPYTGDCVNGMCAPPCCVDDQYGEEIPDGPAFSVESPWGCFASLLFDF